ncbi:Pimeloyl-ACP methyl ester carboxylesterase [Pseudomonas cuatrocienegasensis]|uniref:Pimeloyl-ACP methyl ester carboxylesterase n=1 Tax=Pseudomonas cuatrocienegasensis TaxID=543360 RepID=A0ABY1BRW7_9PSED|nr:MULTISPECIES: alpha/beta hydrolase [Pseudomonas]OEC32537.1 alpha/beta hydrolase [Pseudomonas sp. 21C1]SER48142.1 Pimeloyl-ACP methyl ester carboxylesterase [Pseudomonas cuatrocienegasensis]
MQQLAATKGKNIQVNGTTLWVADTGEAELPVVLCLHSCFLDGTMFDGLVQAAAGKFRVIRPDFRGQGKSALHDVDIITMDDCADDMLALIEAMQLKDINVMAQSMGGDVAFRLIARRQALFRSLVVAGSSACGEPPEQGARFAQWVVDAGEQGFTGEILDMTMEVMFGKTTRNNPDKQALMAYWRERIAALPKTLRPAMKGVMHRETSVPLLPSIRIPVLIINGEEDMPRPPAWSDEMKRELPNAKLMRLSKIGHSPTLEAPEQVLPAIIAFYSNPSV